MNIRANGIAIASEIPLNAMEEVSIHTDYDFVIGPIYRKYAAYREFYKAQREKGRYVILDNGAFEGELLEAEDLLDILEDLKPQEIVAPDVIADRKATIEKVGRFVEKLGDRRKKVKLHLCPQGSTVDDYISCYKYFTFEYKPDVVGISYFNPKLMHDEYLATPFTANLKGDRIRLRFLHTLIGREVLHMHIPHHLLGLGAYEALVIYRYYSFIRSIDTSLPVTLACSGINIFENPDKPKERLDYENQLLPESIKLACRNIDDMRRITKREEK